MTDPLADFQSKFDEQFASAKCWRCDDTGAVRSGLIVPRRFPCLCEEGQAAVEGNGFLKRVQTQPRF